MYKQDSEQDFSKWSYAVIPEERYDVYLGRFHTYGIQITGSGNEDILHDVSVYKEVVTWMTELFNRHQLSPIHLKDVVEDMLS